MTRCRIENGPDSSLRWMGPSRGKVADDRYGGGGNFKGRAATDREGRRFLCRVGPQVAKRQVFRRQGRRQEGIGCSHSRQRHAGRLTWALSTGGGQVAPGAISLSAFQS